jgi:hypothetical protein
VSDTQAALRVGQMAAVVASDDNGLHAVSIAVRHEVSGPVTSVGTDAGSGGRTVVVAGQQVMVGNDIDGVQALRPGDWIAVSGLRQPNGVIAASRIDQETPGAVLVRGPVMPGAGGWRIGNLWVRPPYGTSITPGESLTARGTIANGTLAMTTASPDVLGSNPAAYFGGRVRRMVIESYVSGADGHVRLGGGLLATAGPGIAVPAGSHRAIVELEVGADGGFIATGLRGASRSFAPRRAPVAPEGRGTWAPHRMAPHGMAPHRFGPPRYPARAWQNRQSHFGHGGYRERRRR